AESGLHYNYFRYYDPSSGRYVTSDPIGLDGGLNTFGYVGGNPNNRIDPFGRSPEDVSNAWKWLEINYPELTKDVNYYTNPILNYTLYSGMAYGNSIVFREKYLTDCLSDQQVEELKDTLIHELLHLHLSKQLGGDFNYMASDIYSGGEYHDWVYQKSAEILQYWQGTVPANSARPSINTYPK
ncbi:MAG: RHS repeat-associated core domain-containing protein, partial [Gammaproteobacteria bacterium]|nr:RHS repeat-associated core domain-containing protein [Gammaproteobacteria bacterium]